MKEERMGKHNHSLATDNKTLNDNNAKTTNGANSPSTESTSCPIGNTGRTIRTSSQSATKVLRLRYAPLSPDKASYLTR